MRHPPDQLIWHYDREGKFSVRNAYRVAQHFLGSSTKTTASASNTSTDSILWWTLWKANIPAKVKVFWWRVCLNILPTHDNLAQKKVPINGGCVHYGLMLETTLHVLRDCPFARCS
ncbi:hypothetical protein L3X38_031336 [Prunus dulcis]|uniref:Reverse transcriptase zinc-binding domain-containing protein n=1 Tax=Prunus dulcis TaxID=3755 RepID=A0AAD4VDE7_PRUDU|nr:hypothetical protein L3X38_031336 [Prunus dulcis]